MITPQLQQYTYRLGESFTPRTFCCEACGGIFPEADMCRSYWSNCVCPDCQPLHPCDACGALHPLPTHYTLYDELLCPACSQECTL